MTNRLPRTPLGIALAAMLLFGAAGRAVAQGGHGAHAVSVAGEWQFTMQGSAGSFDWNVTFAQDGQELSGFAESEGRVFALEGWVDGDDITFYVTIDDGQHGAPLEFTGEVEGESASGTMDPAQGEHPEAIMDWSAERADG